MSGTKNTCAYRIWAGSGTGQPCTQCGEPIDRSQVEYEVQSSESGGLASGEVSLRFHLACLDAWKAAR